MSTSTEHANPKLIASLPTPILNTLPAGQPPPGVKPNFANPPTRVPVILGVGIAFIVLAIVCFFIRIYTKVVVVKKWKWDDLTCSLGFICSIVYFAAVSNGCINGAAGRHQWDVHLNKTLNKSSLYQSYITTIMVTPALGLIKSSLFIQYYLLFRPLRWIRVCVWIGASTSCLFYTAVSITAFALESPWPGESLLDDILSWHYLKFSQFSVPTGVIGMLVDWYLLILPIPAVLALQMSMGRKLGVLVVFMTGGLAAIASTVSLYWRVQLQNTLGDATWGVGYVLLWAQIEMFAGVAASSMPTVFQFFHRQDFSLASWRSIVKITFSRPSRIPARIELPESDPRFPNWDTNRRIHSSSHREVYGMKQLKSSRGDRQGAKPDQVANLSQMGDSQTYLTHGISAMRD